MKKIVQLAAICGLTISSGLFANTLQVNTFAGIALSTLSNSATVSPTSGLTNTYTANDDIQTGAFLGLGAEYVFNHLASSPVDLGLGISGYFIGLGDITGTEIPGSNLGLTAPLNYSIKATSMAVMFEPKLTFTKYPLQPFISIGIGSAWNTLSKFTETIPAGSLAAPSNPYGDHTANDFAYDFTLGIQYQLKQNQKLSLRLEYHYFKLGDGELGAATNQTSSQRLSSNNMSTNIIGVGLSYKL